MRRLLFALLLTAATTHAQWQLQDARTTADLRSIDNVGKGVAWASGSDGTILRTEDAGFVWQVCAKPPGGEHLDFRAIQAFDNNTAIVMSSGKGDLSRLYQTTDGCSTWTLIATNPDPDGFWDAAILVRRPGPKPKGWLYILGDPVRRYFVLLELRAPLKPGQKLKRLRSGVPKAKTGESAFAASNSALQIGYGETAFGTGGGQDSHWHRLSGNEMGPFWESSIIPLGDGSPSSGMFSVQFRSANDKLRWSDLASAMFGVEFDHAIGVAVGGDFQKPDDGSASAAYTTDGGIRWDTPPTDAMPHGYRSAVAYDPKSKTWITVGPNGTDISTDDGRNWRALLPSAGEAPDTAQHWNALSLPFAVGPHGRIATLRPSSLGSAANEKK
jgi:photosystem II stability/assembly factor-like uncharacterized protein